MSRIDPSSQTRSTRRAEAALLLLIIVATVLMLLWLLRYRQHGLDFTDEGFYLVWIANPFAYDVSTTLFGFVYHPLHLLVGGSVSGMRVANIAITFSLAWLFAWHCLQAIAGEGARDPRRSHATLACAAGLATSALILFDSWLATPNYNSLGFQALLIYSTGALLAAKEPVARSVIGWLLIGAGGWLAFMAKPTIAVGLAAVTPIYLIAARKFSMRLMLLAAGCALALMVMSAWIIDGSLHQFVERFRTGVHFASLLESGHTALRILRVDTFTLGRMDKIAFVLVGALALAAVCLYNGKAAIGKLLGFLLCVVFFAVVALLTSGSIPRSAGLNRWQGLLIWAIVFAAIGFALITLGRQATSRISASQWALAGWLVVLPHVFAFGTNQNYWETGSTAAIFWLFAAMVVLGPIGADRGWGFCIPLVLVTQAVTALLVQTGQEKPYRQPQPLRLNSEVVDIGQPGSKLVLSTASANYLRAAIHSAREAGFQPGTGMLDLTGQSPAILLALGARSVGQPWLIGGYKGSPALAAAILERVRCEELATAWVLHEPAGTRRLPPETTEAYGAKLEGDYVRAATWQTAPGAGGYAEPRTQVLYRPRSPADILRSCLAQRASPRVSGLRLAQMPG